MALLLGDLGRNATISEYAPAGAVGSSVGQLATRQARHRGVEMVSTVFHMSPKDT